MRSKKATRATKPITALAALLLSTACGGNTPAGGGSGGSPTGSPSAAGTSSGAGANGSATPGAGGTNAVGSGGSASISGSGGLPTGSTSSAGGGAVASGGGAGGVIVPPISNSDHCLYGYGKLPSDDTMAAGPVIFKAGSLDDTTLQPEVLQWMSDNKWTGAHVIWHAVRGCKDNTAGGLLQPLGLSSSLCTQHPEIVPADQNCKTSGDGYQFLLFHRHMLQSLKALWPKHAGDFAGFAKFPTTKADLPAPWNSTDPNWGMNKTQILAAADIGDNIDKPDNMAKFPTEGALGHWLQCNVGAKPLADSPNEPYIGLHFNLHDQWARQNSAHGLNDGQVNVTNYMFWKLHGWIDNVWEKYRIAKGITKDATAMQKYTQDLKQSCNEMDQAEAIIKGAGPVMVDCPPDVNETGDFHTKVRPIFESATNHCASCHGPSQTSPYANLTLGGQVSSKCIVGRLKRASMDGGQIKLLDPGNPEGSFLYLKPAGLADAAGCVSSNPDQPCNTAAMPPSGKTMTDAELKIIYDWIKAGAVGPT